MRNSKHTSSNVIRLPLTQRQWKQFTEREDRGEAIFKAVDRLRIVIYFLTVEAENRPLKRREGDMLESGIDEIARLAEELVALWRGEPIEPLTLP